MYKIVEYNLNNTSDTHISQKNYKSRKKAIKALKKQLNKTQKALNVDRNRVYEKKWKWKNYEYDFDCKLPWWREGNFVIAIVKFPDLEADETDV